MDEFLLKKQQVFHSLESITFMWLAIVATALVILYGYHNYRKLKTDISIRMKMFNRNFFLNDRQFFEEYGAKKELQKEDFIKIYRDVNFREQLWQKEAGYYEELIHIVEKLKLFKFYKSLAVTLLGSVLLLEVLFVVLPLGN